MLFPHEDLTVYQKALDCFGALHTHIQGWSKQHAFVDHLARALESILYNLVDAARLRSGKKKLLTADYAIGSVFESAACLDVAMLKGLLDDGDGLAEKERLLEVSKMLIGLRNSWQAPRVAEHGPEYGERPGNVAATIVFHHETLDMYTVALDFYRWFLATPAGARLPSAFERSVDTLATRMVLNIAEGNGRYAQLSQQDFIDTANGAAVKLAVCLDMGVRRGVWNPAEITAAKGLLVRVGQMTARKDDGRS